VLGVNFDPLFGFATHAEKMNDKKRDRNRVLKALAGSTWGKDKETLATTYKAIGRSTANYAAPVWSPCLSETKWRDLQTAQNAALRTITGCHMMTHPDHLHQETEILPVRDHCQLLTRQYLLGCMVEGHPNYAAVCRPRNGRNIRHDLREFLPDIGHFLDERPYLSSVELRPAISELHNAIDNYRDNIVLGGRPPPIDASETSLPVEAA